MFGRHNRKRDREIEEMNRRIHLLEEKAKHSEINEDEFMKMLKKNLRPAVLAMLDEEAMAERKGAYDF